MSKLVERLRAGDTITGKWNRKAYLIERKLGEGANGKVYLVKHGAVRYALKIGNELIDHQLEVNVLQAISTGNGTFKHFLVDQDDFSSQGEIVPFYVMKYVSGRNMDEFVQLSGQAWIGLVGLRLLRKLTELHERGWVFGDLKLENVLVSRYGEVELVDFGGVTQKGRAVRQFTELYDRGYWSGGPRTADERYDLFSFAILMLYVSRGTSKTFAQHWIPQIRSVDALLEEVDQEPAYALVAPFARKALRGTYNSSREAYAEWKRLVVDRQTKPKPPANKGAIWTKMGFAASLALFLVVVYYYWI